MESGGELEGAQNSKIDCLEVSVSVEDLKLLLGRLGDLEDPYFKHLEETSDVQSDVDQEMIGGSEEWSANLAAMSAYEEESADVDWGGRGWCWDGFSRCRFVGEKDNAGHARGEGSLTYTNGDRFEGKFSEGVMDRVGTLEKGEDGWVVGEWMNGLLEGAVLEKLASGGKVEGRRKAGVWDGITRELWSAEEGGGLRRFGRHHLGRRSGWWWEGGEQKGGWLGGREGRLEVFIYTDMKTAISGTFSKDGRLVEGRQCEVLCATLEQGVLVPALGPAFGSTLRSEELAAWGLERHPMVADPYEGRWCQVLGSKMEQGGEGLFAKREVEQGDIVAFYGGLQVVHTNYASDYKIRLNDDTDIDIPQAWLETKAYCATLAHKTNHSFKPNSQWNNFFHPRFGLLRSVQATKHISEGEEILVNYKMGPLPSAPDWYKQVLLRHLRSEGKGDEAPSWLESVSADLIVPPPLGADTENVVFGKI